MSAEWLKVGARVASVRNDHHQRSVRFAVVEKIGTRDVVLDNGERFNLRRLARDEGGSWGWTVRLMAADDPFVAETLGKIKQAQEVSRARIACEQFFRRDPEVTAFDVILALAPLTGVADEIAALDKQATS